MSEATIRGIINTIVKSVSNVGQVYDYERWAVDYTDYINFYKTSIAGKTVIRGWTITCSGWPNASKSEFPKGSKTRPYVFKIRGYVGNDDKNASEKTAIALAESVCDALDEASTLYGVRGYYPAIAILDTFEQRLFGNILVHYIEITQTVGESLKL